MQKLPQINRKKGKYIYKSKSELSLSGFERHTGAWIISYLSYNKPCFKDRIVSRLSVTCEFLFLQITYRQMYTCDWFI